MTASDPLNPRKQARQTRSVAMVGAIIEAAARILETGGFGKYSTNEIARRAGVSVGSLYQYFPNKDAVTRALMREQAAALVDEIDQAFAEDGASCALSDVIEIAVRHQFQRPALAKCLEAEEFRLGDDPERARLAAKVIGHIADGLRETGYNEDPTQAAVDIMAMIRGLVDTASARDERDTESLTTRVHRAVFGYLEAGRRAHVPGRQH